MNPTLLKLQEEQEKRFAEKFDVQSIVNKKRPHVTVYHAAAEYQIKSFLRSATQEAYEAGLQKGLDLSQVNRVEVIDHTAPFDEGGGRAYVYWHREKCESHRTMNCPHCQPEVTLALQDEDRTLKVFISHPSTEVSGAGGTKNDSCPPHNFVDYHYEGAWGGSTPPPNKKCTKCLLTERF